MTSHANMTAFVPDGDSRKDTATLLLGAALDHGMDDSRVVVAAQGGFYITDELADALADYEVEDSEEPANPEVKKAEDQLAAQRPPVEDPEGVVDNAVDVYDEDDFHEDPVSGNEGDTPEPVKPKAKKSATKSTSGNRAAKQTSDKEK